MKKGWEIKRLDDIIESNIIGLTKNSSEQDIHHMFKYVKMNNITRDNRFDLSKYTCVNVKKEEVEKYSLSDGDFLFNTRNSYELVGKTCLFEGYKDEVILYNNNIMRIRFLKNINPFFINYAFSTDDLIKKLDRLKSGTTNVSAIYYKDLKNLELLVPPLPEQQRIVAILDSAFAAIAKAKDNAEQNHKNAKELFESYLQNIFSTKGEGWEEKSLGEVCSLITDGKHGDCENEANSGFYFLSAKDVRNGTLLFDNARQITKSGFEETHRRTNLKPGDICMVNTGATIGRISFAPDDHRTYNSTFQKSVAVIKTIPDLINNQYCCYLLQSDLKKLVKVSSGTAVPNLLLGDLKRHKINLPKTLKAQQILVQKLDALSTETKKLEAIYQQKINDLEELKKSILQKAFCGELVTAKALV